MAGIRVVKAREVQDEVCTADRENRALEVHLQQHLTAAGQGTSLVKVLAKQVMAMNKRIAHLERRLKA